MKQIGLFLTALLLVSAAAFGQQSALPASDPPATKEDVQNLFQVMQVHQQMRQVMDAMLKQQSTMMHETLKRRYPQTSAEKIARADRMIEDATKDMPLEAMLDDMIPIYQKHFSKADIDAMSAFYASPTGQKVLREMPALTSESIQASDARMQKQMDAMMQRAEQIMKEDQEKPRAKPAPPPSDRKN